MTEAVTRLKSAGPTLEPGQFEPMFQAFAHACPFAVLIAAMDGRAVYINERFQRLFDVDADQIVGQHAHAMRTIVLERIEDANKARELLHLVLPNPGLRLTDRIRLKDGVILDVTVGPMLSATGETIARAWFMQDVTEIVRAEEARAFTADRLEQNAEEMAAMVELYYHAKNESEAARKELEQQRALLERLVNTDPLTGVANRRCFMAKAAEFEACRRRYAQHIVVMMIDVDHFKRINDSFGHAQGDEALKALAKVGRQTFRKVDLFARMGGEEFAALMADIDPHEALEVAERFRAQLAAIKIETDRGVLSMTVSIGVATVEKQAEGALEAALNRADRALYRAKEAGRNRIVLAGADD